VGAYACGVKRRIKVVKIGMYVSNFCFEKVTGQPMHEAIYEDGVLKEMRYLSIRELQRTTEDVLRYVERLGVEEIEVYQTLQRFEAMLPVLKNRGDMELTMHECNAELWYPGTGRISSENSQVRKVVAENLKWLIDMAGEVKARAIVLHGAKFDEAVRDTRDGDFGTENVFGFEGARRCEIELLKECSQRAERQGVILARENGEPESLETTKGHVGRTAEELAEVIDEVGSESVQCTLDVGHAGVGFSAVAYARILGQRIAHVHLHDCDGKRAHLRLGDGKVDFEALFSVFAEIEKARGDEITIVLENEPEAGAAYEAEWEKLKRLKAACC
jgi:sugar phosphate isomerase/epimerase